MTEAPKFNQSNTTTIEPRWNIESTINKGVATRLCEAVSEFSPDCSIIFIQQTRKNISAVDPFTIYIIKDATNNFPQEVKGNPRFPFYVISLNALHFLNSDEEIGKLYRRYFFNESGQGLKEIYLTRDEALNSVAWAGKLRNWLKKLSVKPKQMDIPIYLKPSVADYDHIKKLLTGIEHKAITPLGGMRKKSSYRP